MSRVRAGARRRLAAWREEKNDLTQPAAPLNDPEATFQSEVASRFGLMPNFFQTAADAPGLIAELWGFAKSAYLDNPLPSVFKERLFVHLSRFCEVRYCIVRHVGFLIGNGNPAGDPAASPESVEQVVKLLRHPAVPEGDELAKAFARLEARPVPMAIPSPDTEEERDVFAALSVLFVEPARAERARCALRIAMGGQAFELLTAYLAFIRTAHYWTVTHPELAIEDDMYELMQQHQQLADLLLDESDSARCDMGQRLYDELVSLRGEHDDRIALRHALSARDEGQRHQQLLINELNHRVKNTLAIVQSLAAQTFKNGDAKTTELRDVFLSRLLALADAHDVLTERSWDSAELRAVLAKTVRAFRDKDGAERVSLNGPPLPLAPRSAVAIAMAFHELATNAVKYGALSTPGGQVNVEWEIKAASEGNRLAIRWSEEGGPPVQAPAAKGFGSRLIERGLAGELEGTAKLEFAPAGLVCAIEAPLPKLEPVA